MGTEKCSGLMVQYIKETGLKVSSMGLGSLFYQMELSKKESSKIMFIEERGEGVPKKKTLKTKIYNYKK